MTILAIFVFGIMCMFVGCVACMKLYVEISKNQTRIYPGWKFFYVILALTQYYFSLPFWNGALFFYEGKKLCT